MKKLILNEEENFVLKLLFENVDYCEGYDTFNKQNCYCLDDAANKFFENLNNANGTISPYIDINSFNDNFKYELQDLFYEMVKNKHIILLNGVNQFVSTAVDKGEYNSIDGILEGDSYNGDEIRDMLNDVGYEFINHNELDNAIKNTFDTIQQKIKNISTTGKEKLEI